MEFTLALEFTFSSQQSHKPCKKAKNKFCRELAHVKKFVLLLFYRATARDRAEAERRRGCMACSFPEEVHNPRRSPPNPWRPTPHATLFPLFSPKRCLFRSLHASYLSYFVKLRPKNNSFFHINAPALLLKQPLFVLMQLFFTFTPI